MWKIEIETLCADGARSKVSCCTLITVAPRANLYAIRIGKYICTCRDKHNHTNTGTHTPAHTHGATFCAFASPHNKFGVAYISCIPKSCKTEETEQELELELEEEQEGGAAVAGAC